MTTTQLTLGLAAVLPDAFLQRWGELAVAAGVDDRIEPVMVLRDGRGRWWMELRINGRRRAAFGAETSVAAAELVFARVREAEAFARLRRGACVTQLHCPGEIFVTRHALERLREHHPEATISAAMWLCVVGEQLEPATARGLCGRRAAPPRETSFYVLTPDRRGVLVLEQADERHPAMVFVLVTYLRLEAPQEALARRLWPDGAEAAP